MIWCSLKRVLKVKMQKSRSCKWKFKEDEVKTKDNKEKSKETEMKRNQSVCLRVNIWMIVSCVMTAAARSSECHIPPLTEPDRSRKCQSGAAVKYTRMMKCGECNACLRTDCGKCSRCLDKPKFGGPNRMKQVCLKKKCPHLRFAPPAKMAKNASPGKTKMALKMQLSKGVLSTNEKKKRYKPEGADDALKTSAVASVKSNTLHDDPTLQSAYVVSNSKDCVGNASKLAQTLNDNGGTSLTSVDIVEESDLVELPATQASKATFPPGCCVWILPKSPCENHGDRCDVNQKNYQDLIMSDGKVLSVFLGDVFSSSCKRYYKLEVAGSCGTPLFEEERLVFAKSTPVIFLPLALNAEVLTSVCSRKSGFDRVDVMYSLMISSNNNNFTVKHCVLQGQLRFLHDGLVASPAATARANSQRRSVVSFTNSYTEKEKRTTPAVKKEDMDTDDEAIELVRCSNLTSSTPPLEGPGNAIDVGTVNAAKISMELKHHPQAESPDVPWHDLWTQMKNAGWKCCTGDDLGSLYWIHPSASDMRKTDVIRFCTDGIHYFSSEEAIRRYATLHLGWAGEVKSRASPTTSGLSVTPRKNKTERFITP
ncbi:hypothetical protein ACHAW5_000477 [Stephanodiscus triporus]|uniref:CXXC-type domain-containing protein n=1 Tax=Stephanodiscus triporus TaxID=2934178 RepID=A0ABD3NAF9_9STRA